MIGKAWQELGRNLVNCQLRLAGHGPVSSPDSRKYETGWGSVQTYGRSRIKIEDLTARIKQGRNLCELAVRDTPHFAYAMSMLGAHGYGRGPYVQYIRTYFPDDELNRRISDFDWLIRATQSGRPALDPVLVKVSVFPFSRLILTDGLHRCSAALACGATSLCVAFSL